MAGNVAHVIIPGQRELVRAKREGRLPDETYSIRGKQRSVHNTYFTLPVIFTMISGHRHDLRPLVELAGAGRSDARRRARAPLVRRAPRGRAPAWTRVALLVVGVVVVMLAPRPQAVSAAVEPAAVKRVIELRCANCHAERPTFQGLAEAPGDKAG